VVDSAAGQCTWKEKEDREILFCDGLVSRFSLTALFSRVMLADVWRRHTADSTQNDAELWSKFILLLFIFLNLITSSSLRISPGYLSTSLKPLSPRVHNVSPGIKLQPHWQPQFEGGPQLWPVY